MTTESLLSAARRNAVTAANPDLTPRWAAEAAGEAAVYTVLIYLLGIADDDGDVLSTIADIADELS